MSSSDFQKEKKKWYAILKESGFKDIERNEADLKINSSRFFIRSRYNRTLWEAKAEYYRMAEAFLNEYRFKSKLEKVIWEYHTNAIGVRDIAKLINAALGPTFNKNQVHAIVKALSIKMKNRYLPNSKDRDGH